MPLCRAYSSIIWTDTQRRFERGWTNVSSRSRSRCLRQINLTDKRGELQLRVSIVSVVEGAIGVALAALKPADVLTGKPNAEPDALDVGHMAHKAKRRQRRRLHDALPKLLGCEAAAFPQ
jgi:hypothetical protein